MKQTKDAPKSTFWKNHFRSENKKAQEALKEVEECLGKSEELHRTLYDKSEDGFILLEPLFSENGEANDFLFINVNRAFELQTGISSSKVVGKRAKEVAPELEQEWISFVGKVTKIGKSIRHENYNKRTNKWYDAQFFSQGKGQVGILFRDISKRKKAEQDLEKKQKELNNILDSSPTIIFYKDKDGKILQINKAFTDALKTTKDKVLGKTVFDIYSTEIAQAMTNDDLAVMKSKNPKLGIVEPYESPTGLRWIRTDKIPSFDENGNVIGVLGFSEEITEGKKTEEALSRNEAELQAIFEASPDSVFLIDRDYRFVRINRINFQPTPKDELLGTNSLELLSPDSRLLAKKKIDECFATGLKQEFEHKMSEGRYVFARVVPLRSDSFKDQVLIISTDITERKKAEEALTLSNQRISEILESISEDFMVLDHDWNYIYANRQAAKLVGLEPKEIVGKNFWQLFPQHQGTYFEQNLKEAMDKREISNFELLGQRARLITTYPSAEGITLIATDITSRKMLEKQLQEKERLAAIGQTAGMVGHDIRNPLQSIVSELYLMKEDLDSAQPNFRDNLLEGIENIEKHITYINKIVADLQDYARTLNPEYCEVDVSEVMTNIVVELAVPKEVEVLISSNTFAKIKTDPTFLRRILTNLVNNSIQAMPKGGILELTSTAKEGATIICVSDSGEGIPKEVQAKLFTPMMTTKAKGQGLGLAVVKRLVEALNGNISFESEMGKGTKFMVELPNTK